MLIVGFPDSEARPLMDDLVPLLGRCVLSVATLSRRDASRRNWLRRTASSACVVFAGGPAMSKRFGDEGYAMEELVAELGAAFTCADLDLTPELREDHAAYIGHWLKVLKDDKRAIFTAASYAQRAADFLSNISPPPQRRLRSGEVNMYAQSDPMQSVISH
jgi:hypothetical protein